MVRTPGAGHEGGQEGAGRESCPLWFNHLLGELGVAESHHVVKNEMIEADWSSL